MTLRDPSYVQSNKNKNKNTVFTTDNSLNFLGWSGYSPFEAQPLCQSLLGIIIFGGLRSYCEVNHDGLVCAKPSIRHQQNSCVFGLRDWKPNAICMFSWQNSW